MGWGLATALGAISVALLIITTNTLALFLDPVFYSRGQEKQQIDQYYGLSQRVLEPVNRGIVRYWTSNETLPQSFAAEGADPNFFGQRELAHMEDVRGWVRLLILGQRISLFYGMMFVVASLLLLRTGAVGRIGFCLVAGGALVVVAAVVVGAFAAIDFGEFWQRIFHPLLFSNDFWMLDPRTDHLIQMFPFGFWRDTAVLLVLRSLLAALGAVLLGGLLVIVGRRLV